jgi:AmmeMemoRadiSam system protein B
MQDLPRRPPAVAGLFYPSDPEALVQELDRHLKPGIFPEQRRSDVKACVVPHAAHMYSGSVAGAVYRKLPPASSYVILGPNHFSRGAPLAVISAGFWTTPLGDVPVDSSLAEMIKRDCPFLEEDTVAHSKEHSVEVQLPFLQRESQTFSFAPIVIGGVDYAQIERLGLAIANAVRSAGRPVLVIASSDMNHYEPDEVTRSKDRQAINQILALSPGELSDVVRREQISMCGYAPVVAMLLAAKALGAQKGTLEKYATSADAGGDPGAVVGYAGIIVA